MFKSVHYGSLLGKLHCKSKHVEEQYCMLTHVISLMLEDAIKMHDNASTLLALLTAVGGGGCTMGFHE